MTHQDEFTLFHSPGTRSGRTRMMLDLLEQSYQLVELDFSQQEHRSRDYTRLNPFQQVPTLLHRERVILESAAQLMYLADQVPEKRMAPPLDAPERAAYYELFVLSPSVLEFSVTQAWNRPQDPSSAIAIRRAAELLDQRFIGPLFLGEMLSALDVFLHWSLRFFSAESLEAFPRLSRYREEAARHLDWSGY